MNFKQILLLSIIVTFSILASFIIVWIALKLPSFWIYASLVFIGVACGYVLYDGIKKKKTMLAVSKVLIIALIISNIFLYVRVGDLGNRVSSLEAPQLQEIDWKYTWNTFFDDRQAFRNGTIKGTIFNSGIHSVNATVVFQAWYNCSAQALGYTKELPMGQIGGKSYVTFETQLIYNTRLIDLTHFYVLT